MANRSVFASMIGRLLPHADAKNRELAPAYAMSPRHALAQLAVTGTFNGVFYAEPREQLDEMLKLASLVDATFLAKLAVYAREKAHMKDMPAFLLALLSTLATDDFNRAFPRVVTHGKMLRNFVQIMRSGAVGRKSLGTRPKRMVETWLASALDADILRASIGNDPSLADVIRMVHPKPASSAREALYAYVIGRPHNAGLLPDQVKAFEAFKADPSGATPDVPFQMLTALPLTTAHWVAIAGMASWQMLRQNLNTFARHGVFEDAGVAAMVADRLRDAAAIAKARVLPYQLMVAFTMLDKTVPRIVRDALQDAMEVALYNAPRILGRVVICPDVSGSMGSPVTGVRKGSTSAVRCIDVAALTAAALLRHNADARVMPFAENVVDIDLNQRDTVMTNAQKLASVGGGGTNCSAPLEQLAGERAKVDLVVFVSDNQSWMDTPGNGPGTAMRKAWERVKQVNSNAKLVCIDIQPYTTTQASDAADIMNIGGFSDVVFEAIANFAIGSSGPDHWTREIESIRL
jgi:60 kDa SS-A/Ro ribonucleoprotein